MVNQWEGATAEDRGRGALPRTGCSGGYATRDQCATAARDCGRGPGLPGQGCPGGGRLGGGVRLRALVGLVLAGIVLAGCGSAERDSEVAPSPADVSAPPSSSPLDPVQAAREAALAAYAGMWAAYDQAGRAPAADPADPRLAEFAAGDALANLMTALGRLREQGLVFDGSFALTSPEVVELSPADAPAAATIEDCQDSSNWRVVRADGEDYEDEPGGRQAVFVDVVREDDGVWRVAGFAVREVGTC